MIAVTLAQVLTGTVPEGAASTHADKIEDRQGAETGEWRENLASYGVQVQQIGGGEGAG